MLLTGIQRFLILFAVLFYQVHLWAQDSDISLPSRLEIGGGAHQQGQVVEALIRIRAQSRYYVEGFGEESDYVVLVRFSGDATMLNGQGLPSYVDVQAQFIGYGYDTGEDTWRGQVDATLVNFNYHRNLQINEDYHYALKLIGVRGVVTGELIENQLQFFAEASFDFIGLAFDVKRAQDQVSLSPRSMGLRDSYAASFETGLNLFRNKVRFAVGGQIMGTSGQGTRYRNGTYSCSTSSNGNNYSCHENTTTDYDEHWLTQKYYLDLSFHLVKALKIFGRASMQVFSLYDETGSLSNSSQRGWLYQVGITYTFGNGD